MIRLAATFGDPAGIGPEVASKAIKQFLKTHSDVQVLVYAPRQFEWHSPKLLWNDPINSSHFQAGRPTKASGRRAIFDLESATTACISTTADALVTGPLDKHLCEKSLAGFTGHTEYLQARCNGAGTTMVLEGPKLRVALVTTHLSLRQVPDAITPQKIIATVKRVYDYLKVFKTRPRIAVCALNPHASDGGLFGDEEAQIISPAIQQLRSSKLDVSGPHSADSLFHQADEFDAVVCMYHDQGLIPLKMKHFYDAVNITLGLPFIRTSVDHGTAFDIAGKSKASSISYGQALEHAYRWVKRIRAVTRRSNYPRARRSRT